MPNPSFEDTVQCPTVKGIVANAANWLNFGGTPDYYNSCNNYPDTDFYFGCSVPANWTGFQYADSGDAYAGLYNANIYTNGGVDREYIGIKLIDTIQPGVLYFFSFKVAIAYKIIDSLLSHTCFSNNIGLKFSTVEYSYSQPAPYNNYSHFHYSTIITDTTNWLILSGSFLADSLYTYLIIGNFYDNQNTSINCDTLTSFSASYIYLDDFCLSTDSVTCITNTGIEDINLKVPIKVFPNAARDWITIEGRNIRFLKINDLHGKLLDEFPLTDSSHSIKIDHLVAGTYLLSIRTSTEIIFKKLIIHK